MAGVGNRGNVCVALDGTLAFRVAGVGNLGGRVRQEDGGHALRVAGSGCMSALERVGGGSAWQVWGTVVRAC